MILSVAITSFATCDTKEECRDDQAIPNNALVRIPPHEPLEIEAGMEPIVYTAIAVFVVGLGVTAVFWNAFKVANAEYQRTGKRAKGYYLGIGMAISMPLGIPLGIALGNIAFGPAPGLAFGIVIGPALGLPFGVVIGTALERRNARSLRPLTARETEARRKALISGAVLQIAVVLVGLIVFLVVK